MTRYCPKCGEPVPSNSLTCPKCYAKIPPEPVVSREETETKRTRKKFDTQILLSLIPGFFGILGLGQIYRNHSDVKGYLFLIIGAILFFTGNILLLSLVPDLLVGILKTIVGVSLLILYAILFFISLVDSVMGINIRVRKA